LIINFCSVHKIFKEQHPETKSVCKNCSEKRVREISEGDHFGLSQMYPSGSSSLMHVAADATTCSASSLTEAEEEA
jgi:hypothetical protein